MMDCHIARMGETKRLYRVLVEKPLEQNHVEDKIKDKGSKLVKLVLKIGQVCTNLVYRVSEMTEFCTVLPYNCVFQYRTGIWHHVMVVTSRILLWLRDFWKILHPYGRN
jgi:hypothetical protein